MTPIFIINIERAPDRRTHMEQVMREKNCSNFCFIEGYDSVVKHKALIEKCIQNDEEIIPNGLVSKNFKHDLKRPGVVGCALSPHCNI